jgi:PAS domain S-box-containing protein
MLRYPALGVALLLIFAPFARALNSAENPADYILSHWDVEDGLPHNSIRQILQTRDGYLWVGTQQGLARFDGLKFTTFNRRNTPAFHSNMITSLVEAGDGSLWIGTSVGLVHFAGDRFTGYTRTEGLKTDTVNALCVAPDGSLWVGSREGVQRVVGGKLVNDIDTGPFDTQGLRAIVRDSTGAMWIATGGDALRYRDGKFTRFSEAQGLRARQVQALGEDADHRIVAATQSGLFVFANERFAPFAANAALTSPRINRTLVDRAGNLWIGSIGGLDRFAGGKVVPFASGEPRKLGVIDAMLEDREGSLWLGTSEGLYRLTDRRAFTMSVADGLSGPLALAMLETRDHAFWVSTWGGGVDRFKDGSVTHLRMGAPLSQESVTTIYEAPDGTLWLGNRGSSVDRLEGDRVRTFVYQPGVATSRPVTTLLQDDDGTLLIGINRRGLLQLRNGEIAPVPEAAPLVDPNNETVWTLARTRDGRLVMGTSVGLFQRNADRSWQPVVFSNLKDTPVVRGFLEDADGSWWLATDGLGLVHANDDTARAYTTREGMIADVLFAVVDDNRGALWVNSPRGIARIRKTEFSSTDGTVDCIAFGRVDGLLSGSTSGSGTPSAMRAPDGRLMFATDKGVAVLDPARLQTNAEPPKIVIESIIADDRPVPMGERVEVPAGSGKLEIRYTALSLIAPERLRFRYQLQGSDPTWVDADRERSVRYTHLAPGGYTFRLLACNNDGVWNETGVTLPIAVLPHFYQTLWFKLAAAFGSLGLIVSVFRFRVRQLRHRQLALVRANAELDKRVTERTAELSRSHAELQQRESLFRLIFEHAPVGIAWKRADLGPNYHVNSAFRTILELSGDTLPEISPLAGLVHPDDAPRQLEMEELIRTGAADSYTLEQRFVRRDGRQIWALLAAAVVRNSAGEIVQVIEILEDISARKQAEQELERTYKRLVDASRVAGMADVATAVLHNVGNVLNSVNVSATLLADGLRDSRLGSLAKLSGMLHEHADDLGQFLSQDPKGQRVLPYLDTLADHLAGEQQRFITEVCSLRDKIEHIKEIVARQQAVAQLSGLLEVLSPTELIDDALHMNVISLDRHDIEVVRDLTPTPPVMAERHKVLQILINLLQNAKEALKPLAPQDRQLRVSLTQQEKSVLISVSDNGVGIPPENLPRIFEHGFTTRANGHGFGLHSSAIAAREMHGRLRVHSDGAGRGATFTLELPLAPEAVPPKVNV